jgi:hypothetical protein
VGSKSIPTDTKNNTAKSSRIGRASDALRATKLGLPHDHPGEKRSERHRCAEKLRRSYRDAQSQHQDRQGEEVT